MTRTQALTFFHALIECLDLKLSKPDNEPDDYNPMDQLREAYAVLVGMHEANLDANMCEHGTGAVDASALAMSHAYDQGVRDTATDDEHKCFGDGYDQGVRDTLRKFDK